MIRKSMVLAAIVASLPCAAAMGQSINIDINNAFGVPTSAYGAGLAQPGVWNLVSSSSAGFNMPLVSLSGAATSAVWTNVTGPFLFSFNNAGTTGNDEALMDDGFDLGGTGSSHTFSITGLTNGTYNLAVYAWAPDSATYVTGVTANGSASMSVGGAWPGSQQAGVTYALFSNMNVTNGSVTIMTTTVSGFSTLNGVQLQLVPAPGALAMLGLAGLVGSRRRRA